MKFCTWNDPYYAPCSHMAASQVVFWYRKSAMSPQVCVSRFILLPLDHSTTLTGGILAHVPSSFDGSCCSCRMGFGVGVRVLLLALLSSTSTPRQTHISLLPQLTNHLQPQTVHSRKPTCILYALLCSHTPLLETNHSCYNGLFRWSGGGNERPQQFSP